MILFLDMCVFLYGYLYIHQGAAHLRKTSIIKLNLQVSRLNISSLAPTVSLFQPLCITQLVHSILASLNTQEIYHQQSRSGIVSSSVNCLPQLAKRVKVDVGSMLRVR